MGDAAPFHGLSLPRGTLELMDEAADSQPPGGDAPEGGRRDSWAHRSPLTYAVLSGLLVSAIWAGIGGIHRGQQPLPLGRSDSLGDFRFTLKSFACDTQVRSRPQDQQCAANLSIRNDGNRSAYPKVTYTLLVNDQAYDGFPDGFGEDVFPDRAKGEHVAFDTPVGVAPTRLVISPYSSVSDFVPLWQTEIVYDLP